MNALKKINTFTLPAKSFLNHSPIHLKPQFKSNYSYITFSEFVSCLWKLKILSLGTIS